MMAPPLPRVLTPSYTRKLATLVNISRVLREPAGAIIACGEDAGIRRSLASTPALFDLPTQFAVRDAESAAAYRSMKINFILML
ncbi:hypothetical protein RCCGEPOP_20400 [Rhizobium sp. Pop5]|nr:hypothetical protein RCCGEPOP_20400 [Rhizobium sp. Pop5]